MSKTTAKEIDFFVSEKGGKVSGLLLHPGGAKAVLALAHGAGAGMRHKFMEAIAEKLAILGVATLRYQFPYMEKGIKRPDSEEVLTATVRTAVTTAKKQVPDLPLFAGGKSMGGRITSLTARKETLENVRGLVFFGFPLHAAGRPSAERGRDLLELKLPLLFLQGSRDALADLELLRPLCSRMGKRAELFVIEGGDHSFHMRKSSGRSDNEVLDEVARKAASWVSGSSRESEVF
ncbi:MAG TPA: alpha/beta family hydrolase [Candidatus Udaeobacter sp.]|nr:alpha/beta family hydrolase [Candidatus Udaeobacter sp.]